MAETCIRVGLIGYGRSGRDIHAHTIKTTGGRFTVAAISDVTESRRLQASAENACPVYADYREMAAAEDIDLFINTAFTNLHVPISMDLLKQKKAVLCEKPLTNSLAEFEALAAAAKETGAFFTVFLNLRYDPVFVKLRQWLASGMIGRPLQIAMTMSQLARRWDWQMSRALGGGVLMVAGVHVLDQALQLAGAEYLPRVASSLKHHGAGDADNYAKVLLTAADGPTIDIECSYYDAFPRPRISVQGTHGTIICGDQTIEAKFYDPTAVRPIELNTAPLENAEGNPAFCNDSLPLQSQTWSHQANRYHASFIAYYDHLYAALTGKGPLPVTMDELRQQVRILEICYQP